MSKAKSKLPPHFIIDQATATGEDLNGLMSNISEALKDVPMEHAVMAGLLTAIIVQKPDIESEELTGILLETSKFLAQQLAALEELKDFDGPVN